MVCFQFLNRRNNSVNNVKLEDNVTEKMEHADLWPPFKVKKGVEICLRSWLIFGSVQTPNEPANRNKNFFV